MPVDLETLNAIKYLNVTKEVRNKAIHDIKHLREFCSNLFNKTENFVVQNVIKICQKMMIW
jgi:hypothetical protein